MTEDLLEAQEPSDKQQTVTLELFDQGMITLFWDEIMLATNAMAKQDARTIATFAGQLRKHQLIVMGAWVDEKLNGLAFLRPTSGTLFNDQSLSIVGLYGEKMKLTHWRMAMDKLVAFARDSGFKRLVGVSTVPAIGAVAAICKFTKLDYYVKDL
ncbi:MAG: hypothetical protein KAH38_05845 [Candidatus Hydrogenedentes bacterium]|nr:hypothetical protein [Candidatus Hydrogenedentota bacterium]